jgi:hypothetical protein
VKDVVRIVAGQVWARRPVVGSWEVENSIGVCRGFRAASPLLDLSLTLQERREQYFAFIKRI